MTVLKPLELGRTFSMLLDDSHNKPSSAISGWLLLRRAGLTADQRHLVMSQCGSNTETMKVEEVMYFFFGQDYRTSAPCWTSSRSTTNSWPRYNKSFNRAYMAEDEEEFGYEDAYAYDDYPAYDPADEEQELYEEGEEGHYMKKKPMVSGTPTLLMKNGMMSLMRWKLHTAPIWMPERSLQS